MGTHLPPDWLPDGWILEIRTTRSGSKRRYYTSPMSGCTFYSKEQVMRYLNVEKVEQDEQQLVQQIGDPPEWLPAGWLLEIKCGENGVNAEQQFECYCDPATGSKFNSKEEVFRYLKTRKLGGLKTDKKKSIKRSSLKNVLAHFEFSPDGLPHGWVKEIKIRKSNRKKDGVRKDPYYTDPAKRYVFRSLKDCFRYIETGEISKHAFRPTKKHLKEMQSEKELPSRISAKKMRSQGSTVRRSLFTEANGAMVLQIDGTPEGPQSLTQCGEDANPKCLTPLSTKPPKGNTRKQKKMLQKPATKKLPELVECSKSEPEEGRDKISRAADGVPKIEKPSKALNGAQGDLSKQKHVDLAENQLQEVRVKRSSGRLKNKLSGQFPVEKIIDMDTLKHLEPEKGGFQLLQPQNESSQPVEKPSELGIEKSLLEEQQFQPASREAVAFKRSGGRKAKAQKAIILPSRRSKRLASLTGDSEADYGTGEQAGHLITNQRKEFVSSNHLDSEYSIDLEIPQLAASKDFLVEGKPFETISDLPFGDFWPDPCIEFAFRTLTSDIPVLEDTKAIEDYFQQQLISIQSSSPGGSVSSTLLAPEISSQSPIVQSEHHQKGRPSSSKKRKGLDLQVQNERRRSMRLKALESIESLG